MMSFTLILFFIGMCIGLTILAMVLFLVRSIYKNGKMDKYNKYDENIKKKIGEE